MTSLPRAVLAIGSTVLGPPAVTVLVRSGRWPGALVLSVLLFAYAVVEVGAWQIRQRRARAVQRAYLRHRGAVLQDVTYSREGAW